MDAEFIPKKADGSEFSLEDRAELLARIIAEVLQAPIMNFVERLKVRGNNLSVSDMNMMVELNRGLSKVREGWTVRTPSS